MKKVIRSLALGIALSAASVSAFAACADLVIIGGSLHCIKTGSSTVGGVEHCYYTCASKDAPAPVQPNLAS